MMDALIMVRFSAWQQKLGLSLNQSDFVIQMTKALNCQLVSDSYRLKSV